MKESSTGVLTQIVAAAVENKYSASGPSGVDGIIEELLPSLVCNDEAELTTKLKPIHGMKDDISNQLVALLLIDHFWSNPPKLRNPLTALHCTALGKNGLPDFRTIDHVDDFGGAVPTSVPEVSFRLDELERLARHSVATMAKAPIEDKALILAYIHGALIRIHPFADGNGRCGRFFIFYALRCWGMPWFSIPKVRNDSGWKAAMDSAVAGDALKLKEQLYRRMQQAIRTRDSFDGNDAKCS
jgi:hypothetical protein